MFPFDLASLSVAVGFWMKCGSPKLCNEVGQIETKFVQDMKVKLEDITPKAAQATKVNYHITPNTKHTKKVNEDIRTND